MHRITRHFFAIVICTLVFSMVGTANGIMHTLASGRGASLTATGLINIVVVLFLCVWILAPIASVTDYLFSQRWNASFLVEGLFTLLLLSVAMLVAALFFGRFFLPVFVGLFLATAPPTLLYWAVFHMTGRFDR